LIHVICFRIVKGSAPIKAPLPLEEPATLYHRFSL
jgi:hypothetical protein